MKQGLFPKILPHLVAIVVFVAIAAIYCRPALEGQVLQQHDIAGWKGAIQQSLEYAKTHHGQYPLWTNSLFSGMPTFQIGYNNNNFIPGIVNTIMTLGLPAPIQYFFLACICFYILGLCLRVNPYVSMIGALGFAYATYNPVIISVGHVTKMLTMAYIPALLGSLILIYEKRYWLGAILTGIFSSTLIAMNHPQIAYYFFITVAIMTIFYVVRWIRNKEWKHFGLAFAFTAVSATIGLLTNAVSVMSTYEYQKETIRGGGSELTDSTSTEKQGTGLERGYAFSYSAGLAEPLVMMVPRMYGGSSDHEEIAEDKSKAYESLASMPQQLGENLMQSGAYAMYWGGIKDVGGATGTSGPPYVGAIICFLAILACFVVDARYKWWILAATAFTIMMAWGSYFSGFNNFLFDHFPLYNKFRAPSMALVIPQLLLPLLAILGVNAFITAPDRKILWKPFLRGLIATGAVFVLLFLIYFMSDFSSGTDSLLEKSIRQSGQAELVRAVTPFFDGLKADRQSLFMGDIWRSLGFVLIAALTIFLLIRNKIPRWAAIGALALFAFVDVIMIDTNYLSEKNYQDEAENEAAFATNQFDNAILADTSFYRVCNLWAGSYQENFTSYHFNSIGGYHPAKLKIYQDLISRRISPEQNALLQQLQTNPDSLSAVHTPTLDMLNAKYFIYSLNGQNKGEWKNNNALGNCWFVSNIEYVKGPNEEMDALDLIDPKQTAVVQESYKSMIPFAPQPDSAASIQLVHNDNDLITYTSHSNSNQFAVFSEIYYRAGWTATIDGKDAPIVKVNYVLRGLAVPPGQHTIIFKFEPQGHATGKKITAICNILLLLLIAGGAFMVWKNRKQTVAV